LHMASLHLRIEVIPFSATTRPRHLYKQTNMLRRALALKGGKGREVDIALSRK
jgi:hypothetical protein